MKTKTPTVKTPQAELSAKPLVISYLRFSTPEQARGDSTRRQIEGSRKWASERGLEIDDTLRDEGVSAFKGRNATQGALSRLLKEIEHGAIPKGSILLVESLDRLSRNEIAIALQQFLGIVNSGITVVTLCDNREYSSGKLDIAELVTSVAIMARANDESATKGMRMRANWEQFRNRASKKEVVRNWVPAWLEIKSGKIVRNAAACKAIKLIFDLACKGYGLGAITRKLNRDGIPVIGKSSSWGKTYVHNILRGRQVLGELELRKNLDGRIIPVMKVADYYPRVIELTTWERANAILSQKRIGGFKGTSGPNAKWVNIFSGLLFDENGQTWTIHLSQHGHKSLVSNSAEQMGKGGRVFVRLDILEPIIFDILLKHFANSFQAYRAAKDDASEIRAEIAELDAKAEQIQSEALESGSTVKGIVAIMGSIEAKRVDAEKRLATALRAAVVTDKDRVLKLVEKFAELAKGELDYDSRAEIQATLRLLVKRITLKARRSSDSPYTIEGDCFIEPYAGDDVWFTFSYRARRNAASSSPLERCVYSLIGSKIA